MIAGVVVRTLEKAKDARGWLMEVWRPDWMPKDQFRNSLVLPLPVMAYVSQTRLGVVRGPHEHKFQTDYFVFLGVFRLRLWEKRSFSPEGQMDVVSAVPTLVVVPPGVVHAYVALEDKALCLNMPNKLYRGEDYKEDVDEIRHENDKDSQYDVSDMVKGATA